MMAAPRMRHQPHLIDRLPDVRGRLTADAPLANVTWFRVGGPAEVLFKPADAADLANFLAGCPADVPVTVIGVASNLLVRDGGVPGVVIRLGRAFADISVNGSEITAGAAALDLNVANAARDADIAGLEFLSGIPGTIGGALRMNGGAYGRELSDVIVSATAIDRAGREHALTKEDLGLSYRHSDVPEDWIFTSAILRGHPGDHAEISHRMHEIATSRAESQPVRARTGGSTFANPPGEKAWALIDRAGCRGLIIGGAQVSEKHCNFLINLGAATADDLESLGEEVRRRVHETSGIDLRWEIRRIGVPAIGAAATGIPAKGKRP
jgi:UDP-N-acetylmuramate dehydrogenase